MTPIDSKSKLSATDGPPVADPSEYRSIVGALQYLTLTRPDLAYAFQQVCLFMHDPREPHLAVVKRIFRYVKGTVAAGLHLGVGSIDSLTLMLIGLSVLILGVRPQVTVFILETIWCLGRPNGRPRYPGPMRRPSTGRLLTLSPSAAGCGNFFRSSTSR